MLRSDTIRLFLIAAASSFLLAGPATAGSYDDAMNAARQGDTPQLTSLLARGIDPDTVDAGGNTLLIIAAREGNAETVATLLRFRARIGYRNMAGDSALMLAVLGGRDDVVDVLLKAGAPVNHEGWTALHYAAFEGRVALLDKLLAAGADINALAPNQSDVLMLAARNGHADMVAHLLKLGVPLDRRNDAGLTAVDWALSNGNTDIADMIQTAARRR
ncbi:ankyrin repeat domain-containing protein [Azoarcus sp. L1K30]|uniref:ankyrin repeat domain-containing protein n=1 Tax=Azoarcus sp. L1K30 TaxID=2820277 RepID=UPI001B83A5AC|nr:ankyrin repeat domain-containing protein [Azoarcus sp. L1K30]MBR0565755.1 ankyrin repeat domain-containing protein [Azoarcus sp. L1K30]